MTVTVKVGCKEIHITLSQQVSIFSTPCNLKKHHGLNQAEPLLVDHFGGNAVVSH